MDTYQEIVIFILFCVGLTIGPGLVTALLCEINNYRDGFDSIFGKHKIR